MKEILPDFDSDIDSLSEPALRIAALDRLESASGTMQGVFGLIEALSGSPSDIDGEMLEVIASAARRATRQTREAFRLIEAMPKGARAKS